MVDWKKIRDEYELDLTHCGRHSVMLMESCERNFPALISALEEQEKRIEFLEKALERAEETTESMRLAWHDLISPGKDSYSWQRDWQDGARIVLELPPDATVEDINLALLLRDRTEEKNG